MQLLPSRFALPLVLCCCFPSRPVAAGVIVLANRSTGEVRFRLVEGDERAAKTLTLAAGHVISLPADAAARIFFDTRPAKAAFHLRPNCAYTINRGSDESLLFHRIDLGAADEGFERTVPAAGSGPATVQVKLLVDDEEPSSRRQWERRLTERVAAASQILEVQCRLRLEPVALETWDSDDALRSIDDLYAEFQHEVEPRPAQLVLGFSSQAMLEPGAERPGRSGGLLTRHILLPEGGSKVSEAERLEVLVHEIGHFLGAVDRDDRGSVMRPKLCDGRARGAGFVIQFDPVNALIVSLVAEQLHGGRVGKIIDLPLATRKQLHGIYKSLHPAAQEEAPPDSKPDMPEGKTPPAEIARLRPDLPDRPKSPEKTEKKRSLPEKEKRRKEEESRAQRGRALLKRLAGSWHAVSVQRRGGEFDVPKQFRYSLAGEHLTVHAGDFGTARFQVRLRPPKDAADEDAVGEVDLVLHRAKQRLLVRGIYTHRDRSLRICLALPGEPRPAEFATASDGKQVLITLAPGKRGR